MNDCHGLRTPAPLVFHAERPFSDSRWLHHVTGISGNSSSQATSSSLLFALIFALSFNGDTVALRTGPRRTWDTGPETMKILFF